MEETKKHKKESTRKKIVVEEVLETKLAETPDTAEVIPQIDTKAATTESTASETPVQSEIPESTEVKPETTATETKEEPQPEVTVPQKPSNYISPFWLIIPAIILIIAFAGGIYVYQTGVKISQPQETATPEATASPSTTPSASPSATPNLSSFSIDVQNGSGIAGQATAVKNILEKAGFTVGTIGNADTYDFTDSKIQAKSTVDQAFLDQLSSVLSKSYVLDKSEVLPATSSADIIVIVGQTKASIPSD